MPQEFAHLHVHTEYSLLDGAIRLNKVFSRCDELGIKAIAITDHGNMYGALEFVKAAIRYTDEKADPFEFIRDGRECKVKPIIGCEVYMTDDMTVKETSDGRMPKNNHLVLLAKNEVGYKNLVKLVSLGYTEGFYYKPRIDFELLSQHTEGLICLSACLAGIIPQKLLVGDIEGANEWARKFKALFGDDYYIEIQDHGIREQQRILPLLRDVALQNGIKMVATNDAHYLEKKDAKMQKVLQCIAFKKTMSPDEDIEGGGSELAGSDDAYFPTKEFYLKSGDQMAELFNGYEGAITNTLEIADKCDFRFYRKEKLLPSYTPSDGSEPYQFLRKLCYDGLNRKYGELTQEIIDRAEYELGVISKLGFVDYFLIVWDFIHFSETHDVPVGPGRGSGVGSIVAYAIGITKVNPLKYSLIFERFLNEERVSNPDFDIDFCVDGRERVIQYVIEKYHEKNVSQIVTFGTLAAKAAVKDVGRVFNLPFADVDKITKLMPKMMGKNHIEDILGLKENKKADVNPVIPDLVDLYNNDEMSKKVLDMAMKIEGMPRQTGMHAAGVIICKDVISDHVPMAMSGEGIITTQFNMIECEELGLLKMDFLGLRTLTDISKAVKYVKQTKGIDLNFYAMGYDDPEVYKLIGDGDTHAVFQLEGEGIRRFMRDLRPSSLEDVIAGISLYRPGPMDKIGEYVYNKKHPDEIKYDHPLLEPILKVTYGIMVYQEQVMEIVRKLAGYSFGRADIVRRMMSKKKKDAMQKERVIFINGDGKNICGCLKNGVSEEVANKIFDDMTSFASYAFNKSHAAAYAVLSYQTAYLKRYHTVEFITAVLNNRIDSIDEITNYLSYLKNKNIDVLPPNINRSYPDFAVENGGVRIGMAAIKNVGHSVVEEIVKEREENGEFKSFVKFVDRMAERAKKNKQTGGAGPALNKKMLENLIYAGTFDCFGHNRSELIAVYETVLDRANKDVNARASGQFSFFDMDDTPEFEIPKRKEYPHLEKLRMEKQVAGVYLTGHPLEEYREQMEEYAHNTSMLTMRDDEGNLESGIDENTKLVMGGMLVDAERKYNKSGKEFGIAKLEDLYGTVELMLTGFKIAKFKSLWQSENLVKITGRPSIKDDGVTIWVDNVELWNAATKPETGKMLCVFMSFKEISALTLDNVHNVLTAYPGEDEVYIKNTDDNKVSKINTRVNACEMLKGELFGVDGVQDVGIYNKN
ncbi:MAG: DNA polymerase III subunit alpha [Clostridiales bacterium]|nr:DNA polymerase III subunit alpha [Clostridiales bacterium]